MIKKLIRNKLNKRLYRNRVDISGGEESKHYISFTFDDFAQSAAHQARLVLDSHGIKGTYYVSLSLLNKVCYEKQMFALQDLEMLYHEGHEIGCHTYGHSDFHEASSSEIEDSLTKSIKELDLLLPNNKIKSFAYPKGRLNLFGKKLTNNLYQSSRTTKRGLNGVETDLNMLKANKLYSKHIAIDDCFQMIDQNKKLGSWLIFYTHDVEDAPSDFGCSTSYFEKVVDYAMKSGAEILPVGRIVEQLS